MEVHNRFICQYGRPCGIARGTRWCYIGFGRSSASMRQNEAVSSSLDTARVLGVNSSECIIKG